MVQLSNTYDKHEFFFLNQLIDCMYREIHLLHTLSLQELTYPKYFKTFLLFLDVITFHFLLAMEKPGLWIHSTSTVIL